MACKRALVAAAQALGCAAELFTQDLEDMSVEPETQESMDQEPITNPVLEDIRDTAMKKISDLGWDTQRASSWLRATTGKQSREEVDVAGWRGVIEKLNTLSP